MAAEMQKLVRRPEGNLPFDCKPRIHLRRTHTGKHEKFLLSSIVSVASEKGNTISQGLRLG